MYDFLTEAELQHYYNGIKYVIKIPISNNFKLTVAEVVVSVYNLPSNWGEQEEEYYHKRLKNKI